MWGHWQNLFALRLRVAKCIDRGSVRFIVKDSTKILAAFIAEKCVNDACLRQRLEAMSPDESDVVASLSEILRPSANALREILRLADEVCCRDGIKLVELFASEDFVALLSRLSGNAKDKQRVVRQFLERLRYPLKARTIESLEQCKLELVRSYGIKVDYPHDCEGDSINLTISARSKEELLAIGQKLSDMSNHASLERMFLLLEGEGLI